MLRVGEQVVTLIKIKLMPSLSGSLLKMFTWKQLHPKLSFFQKQGEIEVTKEWHTILENLDKCGYAASREEYSQLPIKSFT